MSPKEALASEVFHWYVGLVVAVLVVAGATLAVLKWGFQKDVSHAARKYHGWLIMTPLVVLSLFLGREVTVVFFTILAIFAFKEYARATGLYDDWGMTGTVYLGILALSACTLLPDWKRDVPGCFGTFIVFPIFVIAAILLIPILRNRARGQLQAIALSVIGFLYIGWMFGHLAFLTNSKYAYGYLMYLLFAVELNDVVAYTFGKVLGRHKLRSSIDPDKTWEGALVALAVSMALPWMLRFSFPHFSTVELLLTGLIVGVAGQLGDLSMSVIKRDLGIEEMGVLIRGHGGILDRIDSLIYVAPLFFHMARQFHDLY